MRPGRPLATQTLRPKLCLLAGTHTTAHDGFPVLKVDTDINAWLASKETLLSTHDWPTLIKRDTVINAPLVPATRAASDE